MTVECAYLLILDVVFDVEESVDLARPANMAGSPLLAMESPLRLGLRRVTQRAGAEEPRKRLDASQLQVLDSTSSRRHGADYSEYAHFEAVANRSRAYHRQEFQTANAEILFPIVPKA